MTRKMTEKRKNNRRRYQTHTEFPLVDSRGDIIKSERRSLPTRRINDITVKEIDCSQFISEIAKQD